MLVGLNPAHSHQHTKVDYLMNETPNIEKTLEHVNKYSAATLNQIKAIPEAHLNRIIAGQLKTTIKAHGPIVNDTIGSASKRITTQLLAIL